MRRGALLMVTGALAINHNAFQVFRWGARDATDALLRVTGGLGEYILTLSGFLTGGQASLVEAVLGLRVFSLGTRDATRRST